MRTLTSHLKIKRKLLYLCFAIFGLYYGIGIIPITEANTGQPVLDYSLEYPVANNGQVLGSGLSGTLTEIRVYANSGTSYGKIVLIRCIDGIENIEPGHPVFWDDVCVDGTIEYIYTNGGWSYAASWNDNGYWYASVDDYELDPEESYVLFYYGDLKPKGSTTDEWLAGGMYGIDNSASWGDLIDWGFLLVGANDPPPNNSVSLYYPGNGAALSADFQTFFVDYTALPLVFENESYSVSVQYEIEGVTYEDVGYTRGGEDERILFNKNNVLNNGEYNAITTLYDCELNILDSSTSTFTIGFPVIPEIDDCTGGGWTDNTLCEIYNFLFVPNQTVVNQFNDFYNRVMEKPPIGYFVSYIGALDIATSTAPGSMVYPDIPDFFNPIKDGLTWLLWILFGGYIIRLIRYIRI